MASGKPILCNLEVNYDLIKRYNLGLAKKFTDMKSYAETILRFAEMDREKYQEYCMNCFECAKQYDYRNLADKIQEILQKTI